MGKRFYIAGLIFGLFGVILGAFAAHGLKPLLSPEAMGTFETGVRYQIYHAFLLLLIPAFKHTGVKTFNLIFYLIVVGIILFSGSIYLLATNSLTAFDFTIFGPVTPLGGSLLIFAWIGLLVFYIKLKIK